MTGAERIAVDTNVLVYAHDRGEPVKGPQARALLGQLFAAGQPLVSVQVLSEFYIAVTRKLSLPLTHAEAAAEIQRLGLLARVVAVSDAVLTRALEMVATHSISLWDAQIFAAALLHGATCVLSEDFQHRQSLEGVVCLNPFASDFDLAALLVP